MIIICALGELGSQSGNDSATEADTLIYFGESELIGVVEDKSGLSLSSDNFCLCLVVFDERILRVRSAAIP